MCVCNMFESTKLEPKAITEKERPLGDNFKTTAVIKCYAERCKHSEKFSNVAEMHCRRHFL